MRVTFRSNLDVVQADIAALNKAWPAGVVPRQGELIQFKGEDHAGFRLRVVGVTYEPTNAGSAPSVGAATYSASVELHIPSYYNKSIREFEELVKSVKGIEP